MGQVSSVQEDEAAGIPPCSLRTLSSACPSCSLTYCWVLVAKGLKEALSEFRQYERAARDRPEAKSRTACYSWVLGDVRKVFAKGLYLVHDSELMRRRRQKESAVQ